MASLGKLKDRARKHEQKENWEAAIQAYQQVLEQEEGADEIELELGLYNRIGDLHLRLGQTDDAVSYYETAADKYAESGFYNNAIALCNKALRHRPDRPEIYLKLSGLCAEQGFQTDARRWILEYAERQMKAGRVEQALTGLENFADLSNDPEVRESLAQQLVAHDRSDEALDQLRHAYRLHATAGAATTAAGVAERARAIDPSVDLESEAPPAGGHEDEPEELAGEPSLDDTVIAAPEEPAQDATAIPGLETRREETAAADTVGGIEGLEPTAADAAGAPEDEDDALSGLEITHSERPPVPSPEEVEADALGGLETFDSGEVEAPEAEEEPEDEEEAEPLPLLDTGFEDEEDEEEAEPLPLLDTGYEDVEEEAPDEARPVEARTEAEVEADADLEIEAEAEDAEEPDDELPSLDLGGVGGAIGIGHEPDADEISGEAGADMMDLDLRSFDLGAGDPPDAATEAEDLDVEAVLQRGREMVSRGLTEAALQELLLLSGSEDDPEVFRDALSIVNEIIRHNANDLAALQRRVEYSARTDDRELLVDAYTDLADALARLGAETKAQAMYERVLDLDPGNEIAREALGEVATEEEGAVDLDAVLMDVEPDERSAGAKVAGESDPSFAAMLSQFKAKVTDPVQADEAGDHYDLGLAFKEMGLIDEAIAEFQTALTGGTERLKVYEELGKCFIQKEQYNVALKVLNRALQVPHSDESELLGVYYSLGQVHEELGQRAEAREAYEKVLGIDETFGDVPDRVARL